MTERRSELSEYQLSLDQHLSIFERPNMRGVSSASRRRSRFSKLFFCEHCHDHLSKAQYIRHRRMFFNEASQTWSNRPQAAAASFSVPDPFASACSSEDENMCEENPPGKH